MSLEWTEVLDRLLTAIESTHTQNLTKVCVVRDLRGCLRLCIRRREGAGAIAATLENDIARELGPWFAGPVLWDDAAEPEVRRLATQLLDRQQLWPLGWPSTWDDGTGNRHSLTAGLWSGEERVRAKQSWLARGTSAPPWPRHPKTPAIVSFYSFKGGVGRTTTLGVIARSMAKQGLKVVIVDLDLEAPGLARFFDVTPDRGVLDLLVEHLATGQIDYNDLDRHSRMVPFDTTEVLVFPVGQLDWPYIEKLGRLDFTPHHGANDASPVEQALREVLSAIKRRYKPDYILLDARAGLHDIGGLSLHALSHVDVLVGRRGAATRDGFMLAVEAIGRRREPQNHRVIVVQTFVPSPLTSAESIAAQEDWRNEMWDCFESLEAGERPAVTDRTARHFPWPIAASDALANADRIQDIEPAALDTEAFVAVRDRIHELCLRSPSEEEDAEGSEDGREEA